MSARLAHLELTEEDLRLWGDVLERFQPKSPGAWYEKTLESDRMDANLMFHAVRSRLSTFPLKCLSQKDYRWLDCGGVLS